METKQCSKCGVEKALCDFHKKASSKDGFRNTCKLCRMTKRKPYIKPNEIACRRCGLSKKAEKSLYRPENRNKSGFSGTCRICEETLRRIRGARNNNKQKPKLAFLCCSQCNIEKPATDEFFHKHSRSLTGFKSACKDCRKKETRNYNSREETKHKARQRRKQDPSWRLRKNVSTSIANNLRGRGYTKDSPCFDYLDYTLEDLREHLESQFEPWMSWDNWGQATADGRTWNIDHIYPHSKLPYDSMEHPNFKKCWALDNLRPLCAIENIKKSNKII